MSRAAGPAVAVALLALCLVSYVGADQTAKHGHPIAALVVAGGASLAGLGVMLISRPRGRR